MEQSSPYKIFFNWLFDGKKKSPIPQPDVLLKYNSPISENFLLKMFIDNGKVNHLLNNYNHMGIRYIDKEDLFYFIKHCTQNFKIKRRDIHYFPRKQKVILVEKLRQKLPLVKAHELSILATKIEKSKDKEKIYSALGIDKPKKVKKRSQKEKTKIDKISLKTFLEINFEIM